MSVRDVHVCLSCFDSIMALLKAAANLALVLLLQGCKMG